MKSFLLCVLILIAFTTSTVIQQESPTHSSPNPELDISSLVKKPAREIKDTIERMLFSNENPEVKHDKLIKINELLRHEIFQNLSTSPIKQTKKMPERRLQVDPTTLTSDQLSNGNDSISTSTRLTEIQQQEKAMQNYQRVHFWLDDVNNQMNDLRSNINRRLQDMSVGLQRRSLLMGHYNFMGQGIGAPNGESMSDMNPYAHF